MKSNHILTLFLTISVVCATDLISNQFSSAASPTITIAVDGSIEPSTAPIRRDSSDLYVMTNDIASVSNGITVERNNITLDGDGHTLAGIGTLFTVGISLSNRSSIVLKNTRVTGYHYGIKLDSSSNIELTGNVIEKNMGDGIFLNEVVNSSIIRNSVVSNLADGIFLYWYSNNNDLSGNIVKGNGYRGIDLFSGCNGNIVTENDIISNNMTGIYFSSSSYNKIYHNNFVSNIVQAEIFRSQNSWDNGYPSGGNFWNDHSVIDSKNGPNQDSAGADGIGDTSLLIDGNNSDNYPLVTRWGRIEGDVNNDLAVNILDAILLSNAYGSSPADINWNPKADFNRNGHIDIFDAIVLATNYGKILQGI